MVHTRIHCAASSASSLACCLEERRRRRHMIHGTRDIGMLSMVCRRRGMEMFFAFAAVVSQSLRAEKVPQEPNVQNSSRIASGH